MGRYEPKQRTLLWQYLKSYKFKSLFIRYFVMILISSIVPMMLVAVILNGYYNRALEAEIAATYQNSISQTCDSLDAVLYEIHRLGLSFAIDESVEAVLKTPDLPINDYAQINRIVSLTKSIELPETLYSFISSTYVFSERNGYIFTSSLGFWQEQSYFDKSWKDSYLVCRNKYSFWYNSRKIVQNMEPFAVKDTLTAFFMVPVFETNKIGTVMINLDTEELGRYLFGSDHGSSAVYLVDENNKTILSNQDGLLGTNIADNDANITAKVLVDNYSQIVKTDEAARLYSVATLENQPWKLVFVVPLSEYARKINDIRFILTMFIGITLLISIIVSFLICLRVFRPLEDIMATLRTPTGFADGNKEQLINQNELKYILANIMRTNLQSKNMEGQLNDYVSRLKSAQTSALQAQISPHFLYNTLETINWMSLNLTMGENEVSRMISTLSKLLRYVLENTNSMVSIKSEIDYTKQYIEIQKVRYNNKFDVLWDVDAELADFISAKIMLQPLVENAIAHGIKEISGAGLIIIRVHKQDAGIHFSITDNGIGIPETKLARIKDSLCHVLSQSDQSIGVNNVNLRIKLIFGEEYGLDVDSVEGKYTTFNITIPAIHC